MLQTISFFSCGAQHRQIVLLNKNKDILNAVLCTVVEF